MRNPANRYDVDKLFILGAGASYAASQVVSGDSDYVTPLDKDFTSRIAKIARDKPAWVNQTRDEVLWSWKSDKPFDSLGLERAILIQLSNREFLDAVAPRQKRNMLSSAEWMNRMSHLICAILRRCRQNPKKLYDYFAGYAYPAKLKPEEQPNRIITFNYDTLLDNALLDRMQPQDLYFDAIRSRRDRSINFSQPNPLLLKLHGSANWRCSDEDFQKIIAGRRENKPIDIPNIWVGGKELPVPDDDVSPLIIPPLPTKPISSIKLFNYLWTRAYEYLFNAKEIIIVGYSLPDADQMAYSMFSMFSPRRLEKVVIADPSSAVFSRWASIFDRRGFGKVKFEYYRDFKTYLDNV